MTFLRHITALILVALSQVVPTTHTSPIQTTTVESTPRITHATTTPAASSTRTAVKPSANPIKKGLELPTPSFKSKAIISSKKKKTSVPTLPVATTTEPTSQVTDVPPTDYEKVNQFARQAVVNILCLTSRNQEISGTGVIIDPRGIILTNAHLGQYFLTKDYPAPNSTSCYVRTGSPARTKYIPELMYISPSWVQNNKMVMTEPDPRGTGQYDFAFLRITSRTDGSSLPESFPFIPPDTATDIVKSEPVVLVSYPAGFLGGQSINQGLYLTSAITSIRDYYTFTSENIDLVSVPGTIISQRGSSGGAVVDGKSTLIGLITTSSDATTTSARELNAITMSHINRTLQNEVGMSLMDFLAQNPIDTERNFQANTAPSLAKLITDQLK